MSNLDNDLMNFRTTWLRTVALAWANDDFKNKLLDPKTDAKALLQKTFNFEWPWPKTIAFSVSELPNGEFRWVGDDWVWPNDHGEDQLKLYLPLIAAAKPIAEKNYAIALADYYSLRPSIFGKGAGGGTPRGQSLLTAASVTVNDQSNYAISDYLLTTSPIRFGTQGPRTGDMIPSVASFLDFEVVLTSAMARAWHDAAFAQLLTTQADLNSALIKIGGAAPPWKLHLAVVDDAQAKWQEAKPDQPSHWESLQPHELTLNLPTAPASVRDRALALAAYNSTGAQYPFSCCA